jgi:hypothetical protein
MAVSGGTFVRKRVRVDGDRAACVVAALAETLGLEVVRGDEPVAELVVAEIESTADIANVKTSSPIIALVHRRLRDGEAKALREAGARGVIDRESSILDVAFAFSEILFATRNEQKRYYRAHGGMGIRLRPVGVRNDSGVAGQLFEITRSGAFVLSATRFAEGTPIEIELSILGRSAALRGRVAFVHGRDDREGMAVEFALDDQNVAPKLFALCEESDFMARITSQKAPRPRAASSGLR